MALLFIGSALLFSCKEEPKAAEESLDTIMTEKSTNLTVIVSENGRRSYRFTTPLLEGYTLGRDPYREFRKGVKITTYQDDSLTTVNATMESNYAIYYENRKLWEAKGNVRIVKHDGTKVFTQQLFWNSTTKRIYSNVDTKIVTANDTHFTEGFESDEELVELNFRHWKGKVKMDEQAASADKDSTAVEQKPAAKPQPEKKKEESKSKSQKAKDSQESKKNRLMPQRKMPQLPTQLDKKADVAKDRRIE
jgi:LPS export ABC transporter protein LptC